MMQNPFKVPSGGETNITKHTPSKGAKSGIRLKRESESSHILCLLLDLKRIKIEKIHNLPSDGCREEILFSAMCIISILF